MCWLSPWRAAWGRSCSSRGSGGGRGRWGWRGGGGRGRAQRPAGCGPETTTPAWPALGTGGGQEVWHFKSTTQHKMGYYHKYTVHILVESVERLKGYRNIYFARFCTSRPPPRQEDCFANLEANNIHHNKRVVGTSVCGWHCIIYGIVPLRVAAPT